MIINTGELKEFLKKATLNYCINNVQIKLTKDKVVSKMISSASDVITILNMNNEIIPSMKATDNLVLNFDEPNANIVPYLNLIDDNEETTINIKDEKITLVQGKLKSNIFFCSPQVVNVFEADAPRADIEYFHEMSFDDDFIKDFGQIKKIGSKFNKVYFGVADKMLYIETSDKQNRFSNGLRIDLCEVDDYQDMSMCFDFKNVVNLMSVLNGASSEFMCRFAYVAEQELGMLSIVNDDGSEKYYLMSRRDNG
jgi:hypothetical protein